MRKGEREGNDIDKSKNIPNNTRPVPFTRTAGLALVLSKFVGHSVSTAQAVGRK